MEWGRRTVKEGRGDTASHFLEDDILVASTDPEWLQGAFETLTRMFYRVELKTNVRKTVGMICRPCWLEGTQLENSYERQEGHSEFFGVWRVNGGGVDGSTLTDTYNSHLH